MVVGVSMPCIPCSGAWGTGGKAGLVLVLTGGYSRKPRDCIKSIGSLALLDRLHSDLSNCMLLSPIDPPKASGMMWSMFSELPMRQ